MPQIERPGIDKKKRSRKPVGLEHVRKLARLNDEAVKARYLANKDEFRKAIGITQESGELCFSFEGLDLPVLPFVSVEEQSRRGSFIAIDGLKVADIRLDICISRDARAYGHRRMYGNVALEMMRIYHAGAPDGCPGPCRLGWFWDSAGKTLIIRNPLTEEAFSMAYSSIRPAVTSYMRRVDATRKMIVRNIGHQVTSMVLLVPYREIMDHVYVLRIPSVDRNTEYLAWKESRLIIGEDYVEI